MRPEARADAASCASHETTTVASPASDAGLLGSVVVDAGLEDGAALPLEAAVADAGQAVSAELQPLLGMYAVRVRFHGQDATLGTLAPLSNELIMLVSIEPDGTSGKLLMTGQRCRDHGVVKGPFSQLFVQMVHPELQPVRRWNLVVRDGAFSTEGPSTFVGYEERAPSGCVPGGTLPRRPAQVWLGDAEATCTCPGSDLPPTLATDCRVNDPDLDGHPGVTIALAGAFESEDYVRLRDASQFTDGIIASGRRHRALFDKLEDMYQLECANKGCTRANLSACPARFNTALFAPLSPMAAGGKNWSCALLLDEIAAGAHFAEEPLEFPSGC
ncbi:MAG: hypothetical protein RLZZ450_1205 [Pseudomonadota bacterium]